MDARAGARTAALVTGGHGFAGSHLVEHLRSGGQETDAPPRSELDLRDAEAVRAYVRELRPHAVFHLAAIASVPLSWEQPLEVMAANVETTANLLEAVRLEAPQALVLFAGSGEVYGAPESLPVTEDARLRPQNPYAVSKAACDLMCGQYADAHGMRIVRTRAFNHGGPGQSELYVMGTLTRQVAQAEADGRSEVVLRTGNVDSARDFTDVRDVVRAYVAAAELDPGFYNVCSGRAVRIRELIEKLDAASEVSVTYEVDPERLRVNDVPDIHGSFDRLREATGWQPEIPLGQTVADAIAAWREALASGR